MIVPSHKLPNVNVKRTTPEAERSSGTMGAGNDGFRTDSQISGGRGIDRGLVKAILQSALRHLPRIDAIIAQLLDNPLPEGAR